jgi:hypothetical protein
LDCEKIAASTVIIAVPSGGGDHFGIERLGLTSVGVFQFEGVL